MRKPKESSRIKMIRQTLGLTQEQLAEVLDLSLSGYKKLESGEVNLTLDKIYTLNEKFGLSANYILFDEQAEIQDVWIEISKLSETEKLQMLLRLYAYSVQNIKNELQIEELMKRVDAVVTDFLGNAVEGENNYAKDTRSGR